MTKITAKPRLPLVSKSPTSLKSRRRPLLSDETPADLGNLREQILENVASFCARLEIENMSAYALSLQRLRRAAVELIDRERETQVANRAQSDSLIEAMHLDPLPRPRPEAGDLGPAYLVLLETLQKIQRLDQDLVDGIRRAAKHHHSLRKATKPKAARE